MRIKRGLGGLAGGVVVYLARLSALGFLVLMRLCLGFVKTFGVVVTIVCVPSVAQ